MLNKLIPIALTGLLLAACGETSDSAKPPPPPKNFTAESKGYYCTMNLTEHVGGKAQIILESRPDEPVWFSTVNQAFGFTRHPGEPKDIAAIYVTDMGQPNSDTAWIDAKTAYYVIESKFVSGMKTVDSVPFSDLAKAEAFAKENGGRVIRFDERPDEWIYK